MDGMGPIRKTLVQASRKCGRVRVGLIDVKLVG